MTWKYDILDVDNMVVSWWIVAVLHNVKTQIFYVIRGNISAAFCALIHNELFPCSLLDLFGYQ